jgi:hypothetical protein
MIRVVATSVAKLSYFSQGFLVFQVAEFSEFFSPSLCLLSLGEFADFLLIS